MIKENPKLLSPGVLAFVGDAVFGLLVRERLAQKNRPAGTLHQMSVELVNATAQSRAYDIIRPLLTEEETAIFMRGRNSHTTNSTKSSTNKEYHTATGLEALFGYLHLSNQNNRINYLFSIIWDELLGNK
ncbi:MAG TPA: ribonuclease III [Clostridiales bacterium]|nr:ribonuclease III [Clostridiales bacterium]